MREVISLFDSIRAIIHNKPDDMLTGDKVKIFICDMLALIFLYEADKLMNTWHAQTWVYKCLIHNSGNPRLVWL